MIIAEKSKTRNWMQRLFTWHTYEVIATLISLPCILSLGILLSGCASSIDENTYTASAVGDPSITYQGVIVNIRSVTVKDAKRLQDNLAGATLGGVAGGVVGSMIGHGSGSVAAATAGALLGMFGGAYTEDHLSTQAALEYTVKLRNGQLITVTQGAKNPMQIGARVFVIVAGKGRSRIILDNGPTYDEGHTYLKRTTKPKRVIYYHN